MTLKTKMKFGIIGAFFCLFMGTTIAQPLQDIRICIDPGHGGYTSDDRMITLPNGVIYWESEGDLAVGLALQEMLISLGADVKMTRTENTNASDISLSERTAIANAFGADYFHSIHTNGSGGTYSLVLYEEVAGSPEFPAAKEMSDLMAPLLQDLMKTTSNFSRGDQSFLGFNLGVLRNTEMPSTLSEGSFHDLEEEGLRLTNQKYLENYAWAIAKSFLAYFNTDGFTTGRVGGVIKDNFTDNPLNEVQVLIKPIGQEYTGDSNHNGFYAFGELMPGTYELVASKDAYLSDSITFDIVANEYTDLDFEIQFYNDGNPLADFTISELPAQPGKLLTFDATNTLDDTGLDVYQWDFGDGTDLDTGKIVGHTFNSEGTFEVTLRVTDFDGNEASLTKTVEVVSFPPSIPELLSVVEDRNSGQLKLAWSSNPEDNILQYHIYYTDQNDLSGFSKLTSVSNDSTSVTIEDFGESKQEYYFKITAENVGNLESEFSDTYTFFKSEDGAEVNILIVDGFTRRSSYSQPTHTFSKTFAEGLYGLEHINIGSASHTAIIRDSVRLTDYEIVLWFLGDESTADVTFSSIEQVLMEEYLEGGGNLFVTGAEIGWDLFDKGSNADMDFYNNYLKADYLADGGTGRSPAIGVNGSDFEDHIIPFGVVYPEDFPDEIGPINGSRQILTYANNQGAGISYKGTFGEGTVEGAVVNLGFALETADNSVIIGNFMADVVRFFLGEPSSIETSINKAKLIVFPTITENELNIKFAEIENEQITTAIYNQLGQLVSTKGWNNYGNHQTLNLNVSHLRSGGYFLIVNVGTEQSTIKFFKL